MTKKEIEKSVRELLPEDYQLIYLTYYGSILYGTNSPESDQDFKGIYIPSKRDMFLGNFPKHISSSTGNDKTKNNENDIDVDLWSIQKFFEELYDGDTGAFDILFSMYQPNTIVFGSFHIVGTIMLHKGAFLSKNMRSFKGYALNQALKYGMKGKRYNNLSNALKVTQRFINYHKDISDTLLVDDLINNNLSLQQITGGFIVLENGNKYLSIEGKRYQNTITIKQMEKSLLKQVGAYGSRTKAAKDGQEWKSLSHALRIAYEMKSLVNQGMIQFPLPEKDEIKQVKSGFICLDVVVKKVEDLLSEMEYDLEICSYPKKPNKNKMDELLYSIVSVNI